MTLVGIHRLGSWRAVAATLVAVLVAATLLIVVLGRHTRTPAPPASVDGMPQLHGPAAAALAEQARVHAPYDEQGALVGVYGHSQVPAFVLLVRGSRSGGLGSFESVFVHGLSPSGAGRAALEHRTEDGIGYDCGVVRVATTTRLAFCFFDDGDSSGVGLVPDAGVDRALRLTSLARPAMGTG